MAEPNRWKSTFVPSPTLVWTRQPLYAIARWSVHSSLLASETTSIGSTGPPGRSRAPARTPRTSSRKPTHASSGARACSATRTTSATSCARCATPSSTRSATEGRRLRPNALPDQLDLVADPHARGPEAALDARELYAAIAALPDDFRDVLVAVDVTGLSYKETARALRIREGTVMSRLYRARQQVVRRIEGGSA